MSQGKRSSFIADEGENSGLDRGWRGAAARRLAPKHRGAPLPSRTLHPRCVDEKSQARGGHGVSGDGGIMLRSLTVGE